MHQKCQNISLMADKHKDSTKLPINLKEIEYTTFRAFHNFGNKYKINHVHI